MPAQPLPFSPKKLPARALSSLLRKIGVAKLDVEEINMGKTALITGVTGQDGSYLAEFLLEKGQPLPFSPKKLPARALSSLSLPLYG